MFDTHCHLNFSAFEGLVDQTIKQAKEKGVIFFVVPGTNIETSKKAIEIAKKFKEVYAAVGIHPHHVWLFNIKKSPSSIKEEINKIEKLLREEKIVAVGEIGLDRYVYQKTKYENYQISKNFIKLQKLFFIEQLKLAKKFKKAIIIHNRAAKEDLMAVFNNHWDDYFSGRMVFHCCEADEELLDFAIKKKIYIGIDGDITYNQKKQEFIKKIPLNLLVLETDSPFLKPKLKTEKMIDKFNTPKNLEIILDFIAKILKVDKKNLKKITTENAKQLFFL